MAKIINPDLPCRRLDLCFNFASILDYLDPALNNMALEALLSASLTSYRTYIYRLPNGNEARGLRSQ